MGRREERSAHRVTAQQWRVLVDLAKAHPTPLPIRGPSARALEVRMLVVLAGVDAIKTPLYALTETGQRVYARLSVGPFCKACGKPLVFDRRVLIPNTSDWSCEACNRASIGHPEFI